MARNLGYQYTMEWSVIGRSSECHYSPHHKIERSRKAQTDHVAVLCDPRRPQSAFLQVCLRLGRKAGIKYQPAGHLMLLVTRRHFTCACIVPPA